MAFFLKSIYNLFDRDLQRLKKEIEAYQNEKNLWVTSGEISNSAGNLSLHICGNLQHYIGHHLSGSNYIRIRETEFIQKNLSRAELLTLANKTENIVLETISKLTPENIEELYPENVFGHEMTTGFFLIHLTTHFNYHLGQINYHRRLLDK